MIEKEIYELTSKLNEYRDAYYNRNESIVTDYEYDVMLDRLKKLEQKTGIRYANSPTQTVGYQSVSQLQKVKHNHPLLSLDKTTDIDEFVNYFGVEPYMLMAKLDGLTCSLTYKHGELIRAESRGDGEIGEDITHNAKAFVNLPLKIPFEGETIVDGECIITYDDFCRINETESTEYKNPRNLVSGSVRQLDSSIAARRKIKFIAWRLYSKENTMILGTYMPDMNEGFEMLGICGFEVVPHFLIGCADRSRESVSQAIESLQEWCDHEKIPIDGVVGTFDDTKYGQSLGMTGHHPKHSLAYKFYQERNQTTLRDIEWGVSRTGLVNPVAIFDPVEIDGTTVTRASLSNISIIEDLELGIGDTITVIKANQIIPMITENLTRSGNYHIPEFCPCCGKPLETRSENGRKMLYCTNENCEDKIVDKLTHFASRQGLNIIGLSSERIRALFKNDCLNERFHTIFAMRKPYRMYTVEGFSEKIMGKLLGAVDRAKDCKLSNLLVALGIPGIGKSTAKDISKRVASLCVEERKDKPFDLFLKKCIDGYDWSSIDGIGGQTSEQINEYVKQNLDDFGLVGYELKVSLDTPLQELAKNGNADNAKSSLDGKTFCITGALMAYPNRDALAAEIESRGGKVVSGVTKKTDYLITNEPDSGSSKNLAAKKYGTKVITEVQFTEI